MSKECHVCTCVEKGVKGYEESTHTMQACLPPFCWGPLGDQDSDSNSYIYLSLSVGAFCSFPVRPPP